MVTLPLFDELIFVYTYLFYSLLFKMSLHSVICFLDQIKMYIHAVYLYKYMHFIVLPLVNIVKNLKES